MTKSLAGIIGEHIADEVEGVHEYHKLAKCMEEQGHPDFAHKLRSMADEEHIHAELLKDMLNQLA